MFDDQGRQLVTVDHRLPCDWSRTHDPLKVGDRVLLPHHDYETGGWEVGTVTALGATAESCRPLLGRASS